MPGSIPGSGWGEIMSQVTLAPIAEPVGPTETQLLLRRIAAHKGFLIGIGLIVFIAFISIFAPLLSPYDPYQQDLTQRLIPPFWYPKGVWTHLLGTDNLGRDYLTRIMYGGRISLLVGAAVTLVSCIIGT